MPDTRPAGQQAAAGQARPPAGRRPLVLDTRELGRRPGAMRRLSLRVPAPADLALELVRVPEGAPVELDLRLEAVMEGVLVTGTALAPVTGECGRCLDPIDDEIEVEMQELYAYPGSATTETTDDDETARLNGDLLDLEPVLRDAVVLALPMTPLCQVDCAGLCAVCGERLEPGQPPHDHQVVDPRWAALRRFGHNGSSPEQDDTGEAGPEEREN